MNGSLEDVGVQLAETVLAGPGEMRGVVGHEGHAAVPVGYPQAHGAAPAVGYRARCDLEAAGLVDALVVGLETPVALEPIKADREVRRRHHLAQQLPRWTSLLGQ